MSKDKSSFGFGMGLLAGVVGGIIAGILAYTGSLICMRDSLTIDLISTIKNKLNHGKRI